MFAPTISYGTQGGSHRTIPFLVAGDSVAADFPYIIHSVETDDGSRFAGKVVFTKAIHVVFDRKGIDKSVDRQAGGLAAAAAMP